MNFAPWIVKAGGDLLDRPSVRKKIFADLGKIRNKTSVLLVHGGGPQIQSALKKNRIANKFIGGRRFTSEKAIKVVEQTLNNRVNRNLVTELNKRNLWALGLSGRDARILKAKRIPGLGRAGRPVKVNTKVLEALLKNNVLPVLSSVGIDSKDKSLNINADDAASAIAVALKASNLVFLTDVSGVRGKNKKRIPVLKEKQILPLIESNVITGGMIPKVQSALQALRLGVKQVTITNGKKGINDKFGTRIIR